MAFLYEVEKRITTLAEDVIQDLIRRLTLDKLLNDNVGDDFCTTRFYDIRKNEQIAAAENVARKLTEKLYNLVKSLD